MKPLKKIFFESPNLTFACKSDISNLDKIRNGYSSMGLGFESEVPAKTGNTSQLLYAVRKQRGWVLCPVGEVWTCGLGR